MRPNSYHDSRVQCSFQFGFAWRQRKLDRFVGVRIFGVIRCRLIVGDMVILVGRRLTRLFCRSCQDVVNHVRLGHLGLLKAFHHTFLLVRHCLGLSLQLLFKFDDFILQLFIARKEPSCALCSVRADTSHCVIVT